jgi:hypothetical protein
LIASSLTLLAACGGRVGVEGGGLVARPSALDLGVIGSLAPVESSIELFNAGRETIHITRVEGGCSCTVPQLEEKTVPPGKSIRLPVVYRPEGRRGAQHEEVKVYWGTYGLFVPVRVVVEDSLEVAPMVLAFDGVAGGGGVRAAPDRHCGARRQSVSRALS